MKPSDSEQLAIFTRLGGRRCLVVGGGSVAERKALELHRAGARVTVVSPTVTAALSELASAGELDWQAEPFAESQLEGCWLVIAATDDRAVNAQPGNGSGNG